MCVCVCDFLRKPESRFSQHSHTNLLEAVKSDHFNPILGGLFFRGIIHIYGPQWLRNYVCSHLAQPFVITDQRSLARQCIEQFISRPSRTTFSSLRIKLETVDLHGSRRSYKRRRSALSILPNLYTHRGSCTAQAAPLHHTLMHHSR